MSFPVGPADGDRYTLGNTTYEYNSALAVWDVFGTISGNALADAQAETATKNSTFGVDTGVVNAVQIDNVDYEVLLDGMVVMFTPANDNTGATTLKVKTLVAKPLFYNGLALTSGYLNTTSKYIAVYDLANDRFDVDVITGGSAKQRFTVADAVNADEAVSKGQLLTEIKTVDGAGSGLDADTVDGVQGALLGVGGAGYAWVDEKANRVFGVTYTNTTGSPIMLSVSSNTPSGIAYLHVQNVLVWASTASRTTLNVIVQNNVEYIMSGSATVFDVWAELKKT